MLGDILIRLAGLAVLGFLFLVLMGLWDRYERETAALGFSGVYERYLAFQAGLAGDPQAYRAVADAERAWLEGGPRAVLALEE
jgi:hypothetical protein